MTPSAMWKIESLGGRSSSDTLAIPCGKAKLAMGLNLGLQRFVFIASWRIGTGLI